jgi:hypothetical protein
VEDLKPQGLFLVQIKKTAVGVLLQDFAAGGGLSAFKALNSEDYRA